MSNSLFQSSMRAWHIVKFGFIGCLCVVSGVLSTCAPIRVRTRQRPCVRVKRGERSRETGQIHCFCSGGAAGLLSNDPLENESDPPDDGGFGLIEGGGGGGGGSEASNGVPGSCAWT